MDIVAYSRLSMNEQHRVLDTLQQSVRQTGEFAKAEAMHQLIRLPTGDGMALVFFGDPEAPVRCAMEIARALSRHPEVALRIGIHTGPVYRVNDINANRNVAGGGINMAQRVMDCGDSGHILLSKSAADLLLQTGHWNKALHSLGEVKVKHGVRLHLFNFYDTEVGNPKLPSKIRKAAIRKLGKRSAIGVVLLAVLMAAIGAYVITHRRQIASSLTNVGRVKARRSVAVLGLKNLTGKADAAWLSTALSQMLTTELAAGEKLRTVPGEDVAHVKRDLSLPDTDTLGRDTLSSISKALEADLVVLGSYIALSGGQIRVDVRLQDAFSGETVTQAAETGSQANLFELVSQIGAVLRHGCGVGQVTPTEAAGVKASMPSDSEAVRLYSEGLAKLRSFDYLDARGLLQKSIEADPNYALAHSALSTAWTALGYDAKARDEAKSAYDLSTGLSREDKLIIEARYRAASKEWDNAAQTYGVLYGFFPDNLEYGLGLAVAQIRQGKPDSANRTLESLRRLPGELARDPRIDLQAAYTAGYLGDLKNTLEFANAAATKARARNSKLLLARSLYLRGDALGDLGETSEAITAAEQARQIYQELGDRNGVASALEIIGGARFHQGNLPDALEAYRNELEIVKQIGNERATASALNNIALVLRQEGNTAQVKDSYQQALSVFRRIGDKDNSITMLLNLGDVQIDEGDVAGAKKAGETALAMAREINNQEKLAQCLDFLGSVETAQASFSGAFKSLNQALQIVLANGNKDFAANTLLDLGAAYFHKGDLGSAKAKFEEALGISNQIGNKSYSAYAMEGLADVAFAAGDFETARKKYQDALDIRKQINERKTMARTTVRLAEIALEQGQAADAESVIRSADKEFAKERDIESETETKVGLINALLAQKKTADAAQMISSLGAIANSQNRNAQTLFSIATARVKLASGNSAAGIQSLQRIVAETGKYDMTGLHLEAQMYLGRAQIKAGNAAAGRALLAKVQEEANGKGFGLIARKASSSI